jgi:hypothetical protein
MKITDELLGSHIRSTRIMMTKNRPIPCEDSMNHMITKVYENKDNPLDNYIVLNSHTFEDDLNGKQLKYNSDTKEYIYYSIKNDQGVWEPIKTNTMYLDRPSRDNGRTYGKDYSTKLDEFSEKLTKYFDKHKDDEGINDEIKFFLKVYNSDPTVGFTDKDIIKWKLLSL